MDKLLLLQAINEKEKRRIASLTDKRGDYLNPVFGNGNLDADVVFIGEAPGATEVQEGKPFVGKAGMQLDSMLHMSNIDRNTLYVTNAVKYRPWTLTETSRGLRAKNRTPSASEIKSASDMLYDELRLLMPEIIVTLGNSPLKAIGYIVRRNLCDIGKIHGQTIELKELNCTLFPLYHPASGIYNHALIEVMENDLIELGKLNLLNH